MKFNVQYTQIANKYFFINTLSQWDFSCEREYFELWINATGSLSSIDQNRLQEFSILAKKYSYTTDHYIGKIFIKEKSESEVWNKLKKTLTAKEYSQIRKIFNHFSQRWKLVWETDKSYLQNVKNELQKKLQNNGYDKILHILKSLFDSNVSSLQVVTVYLLLTPQESEIIGGSATVGNNAVTIEGANTKYCKDYINTIFHEIGHLWGRDHIFSILKKNTSLEKIEQKLRNNFEVADRGIKDLLEELILGCFVPDGYIRSIIEPSFDFIKYHQEKIENENKRSFYYLQSYLSQNMFNLSEYYVKNKIRIDEKFIGRIAEILNSIE